MKQKESEIHLLKQKLQIAEEKIIKLEAANKSMADKLKKRDRKVEKVIGMNQNNFVLGSSTTQKRGKIGRGNRTKQQRKRYRIKHT